MPNRKAIKTADSRMRMIEDRVGVGTWTWDLETSEITWSPGLCRILGLDPHAVVPSIDLYQSLVHPDDQIDFDDAIGVVSERRLESRTFRIIRPDGILRWLHSKAQPHFDRNGKTVMLAGVIQDVTEQQELLDCQHVLKETAKIHAKLLGGWVWRAYPNGKLIETAHWMKLTGQTSQEANDWDRLDAIHPDDKRRFLEAWEFAIENRCQYESTIRVRTVDGVYLSTHSRAMPLINDKGTILFWIGHSTLVSPRPVKTQAAALLDSPQIRASRALVDWTAPELATKSGLSFSTVRRMEQCSANVRADSLVRVRATFESAGVAYFVDEDGDVAIVLRSKAAERSDPKSRIDDEQQG